MTTERKWTRERHETERGYVAAGEKPTLIDAADMLAEIEHGWGEIEAARIADALVEAMSLDNGCNFEATVGERRALVAGVRRMLAAGCAFTPEQIDTLAAGSEEESEALAAAFDGGAETDRALNVIFDGDPDEEPPYHSPNAVAELEQIAAEQAIRPPPDAVDRMLDARGHILAACELLTGKIDGRTYHRAAEAMCRTRDAILAALALCDGATAAPAEDERTQAERWAREYTGAAEWARLASNERAAREADMLPLVREARAEIDRLTAERDAATTDRDACGMELQTCRATLAEERHDLDVVTAERDRLRAEQASRPAPLTEAEAREALRRATLCTCGHDKGEHAAAGNRICTAVLGTDARCVCNSYAPPTSRGDIPANVRTTVGARPRGPAEAVLRAALLGANNALAEVCHGDHEHQIESHADTLPLVYRRLALAAREALDALSPVVAEMVEPEPMPDAPPPHGRCGVVALITDPAGRLLLIRSKKPGRGWELPGGKINGDELWREALCREVREETGLEIALSEEPPRVLDGKRVPGAFTNVVLFAKGRADGEPTAGDDAAEARWFTADEVPLAELSEFASADDIRYWVNVQREIAASRRTSAAMIAAMWAGPEPMTHEDAAAALVAQDLGTRTLHTATPEEVRRVLDRLAPEPQTTLSAGPPSPDRARQIDAVARQVALEKALREPPTLGDRIAAGERATVPADYADRRAAGEGGHGMATRWTPTVGARVVTAADLDPVRTARFGPRLPRSSGTVKSPADDIGEALYVTHDSGEIHAYLADELAPAPEAAK